MIEKTHFKMPPVISVVEGEYIKLDEIYFHLRYIIWYLSDSEQ